MSDTDIRAWALANGEQVSARGPISADVRARYAASTDDLGPQPTDDDFGPDISEPGPPPADIAEKRPRTVVVPKRSRFGFGKDKPAGGRAKKKRARVPIDDTIATLWRGLAAFAKPLPATSRLLKFQAPAAGKILEPIVKDTVVDKILQPIARTTEGAEALAVLVGTPALVTAMQLQPSIIPFAMPVLRDLMVRMVKVAGPSMAEALKAEHDFEAEYGGTVDDLISMLFMGVFAEEGAVPMTAEQEDEAIRKAQEAVQNVAAA